MAERAADAAFDREKVAVPMPLKCRRDGEKLIVRFDNDIVIREGAVKTLMLSENGKEFFPASGKVVDQRELHIVSPQVPRPETVRYAWSNNPVNANLFRADSTSILVSPFEISAEKQY